MQIAVLVPARRIRRNFFVYFIITGGAVGVLIPIIDGNRRKILELSTKIPGVSE